MSIPPQHTNYLTVIADLFTNPDSFIIGRQLGKCLKNTTKRNMSSTIVCFVNVQVWTYYVSAGQKENKGRFPQGGWLGSSSDET